MIRVLITGSNGFVGSHICNHLNKEYEIFGINRECNSTDPNCFNVDITDFSEMDRVFKQVKPNIVIHLAAIVHKNSADTSEQAYMKVNYEASVNIFNLCREYSVNKIIFASTIEVYGNDDSQYINEQTECNPKSYYGKSKYLAERELVEKFSDLNYSILRFTPIYSESFTLNIDKRVYLVKNKIGYYFKKGDYAFSFCSIYNVVEFVSYLVENTLENSVYILSDKQMLTAKEIIKIYKQNGRMKFHVRLPYFLALFSVGILEKLQSFRGKKDSFLSKRNFKKLFESKEYSSEKARLLCPDISWNVKETLTIGEKE